MFLNRVSQTIIISLQCGIIATCLFFVDRFSGEGYAQETAILLKKNQIRNAILSYKKDSPPTFNPVVCTQKQKSACQSKPLSVEQVKLEELFYGPTSSSPLVWASFKQTENKQTEKEFLNIEIYVDRQHRNFQDEIIEIFDQSLVQQTWEEGDPIGMECYCDDRETLAYSFILGYIWGERTQAYLKNLSIETPRIDLSNYGNTSRRCQNNIGECQDRDRLQAAFRFLAIGRSHSGCLIRLTLSSLLTHRSVLLEKHPTFLQKIHVAGTKPRHRSRRTEKTF